MSNRIIHTCHKCGAAITAKRGKGGEWGMVAEGRGHFHRCRRPRRTATAKLIMPDKALVRKSSKRLAALAKVKALAIPQEEPPSTRFISRLFGEVLM